METRDFLKLIDQIIDHKTSDLHLTSNEKPYIRDAIGEIVPLD